LNRRLLHALVASLFVIGCDVSTGETHDAGSSRLVRTGDIPCAPRAVLAAVCQNCHTDPPQNGAPFSQATYADIDAELDGEPVHARMRRAIEDGRMPLDPYTLTDEQRTTLLAWLSEGAPPAPAGTTCEP